MPSGLLAEKLINQIRPVPQLPGQPVEFEDDHAVYVPLLEILEDSAKPSRSRDLADTPASVAMCTSSSPWSSQ